MGLFNNYVTTSNNNISPRPKNLTPGLVTPDGKGVLFDRTWQNKPYQAGQNTSGNSTSCDSCQTYAGIKAEAVTTGIDHMARLWPRHPERLT